MTFLTERTRTFDSSHPGNFQPHNGNRDVESLVDFVVRRLPPVPLLPVEAIVADEGGTKLDLDRSEVLAAAPYVAAVVCEPYRPADCLSSADVKLVRNGDE